MLFLYQLLYVGEDYRQNLLSSRQVLGKLFSVLHYIRHKKKLGNLPTYSGVGKHVGGYHPSHAGVTHIRYRTS
jgi:hypothetical protein